MVEVSVLIAAYNVEPYLHTALNSVIGQSLKNIEIIVVDDGSTDSTPAVLAGFAERDARVRVLTHEKNRGLMLARKTAFEQAHGEYIMFLDGDDCLQTNACEEALRAIRSEKVDILQFDTKMFTDNGDPVPEAVETAQYAYLASIPHKAVSLSPCGLLDQKKIGGTVNFTVWNKIYKRELLEKVYPLIPDEHIYVAEDILFSYIAQFYARTFSYMPMALHRYRLGSGITTVTKITDGKRLAMAKCLYVYTYLKNFTEKNGAMRLCAASLGRVKLQMLQNVVAAFYASAKSKRNALVSLLREYGSEEDIILMLSHLSAGYGVRDKELAHICEHLDMFRVQKRAVKTVGVFYYRMYNGGVENVLSTLTDVWVKSGYRVVLFTDSEPNEKDYYINEQIERVVLPAMRQNDFEEKEQRIRAFRQAILENEVDLMVYNAWLNPHILLDEMIIKSANAALVIHTHGMFCCEVASDSSTFAYHNTVLPHLYAPADSVVTLSEVDTAFWNAFGIKTFKTVNPIKLTPEVEPVCNRGHNVLFVGRISREKQVLDALRIIECVREKIPDATLTLVGSGDDEGYLREVEAYIDQNDLEDAVVMAGFHFDVLPFYQQADVMLSTSRYEGFSLALSESKACGLPLVMYDLPNAEFVRDPKGLVQIEQGDVEAAAEAIVQILGDPVLKKQMSEEARKSAEELLWGTDLSERWRTIFTETMRERAARQGVRPALDVAMTLAYDFHASGIVTRGSSSDFSQGQVSAEQYNEMARMLRSLASSESYRIGLLVTALPRWIKRLFRRKKQ